MEKYTKKTYDLEFESYTIDQKRADLLCIPFFINSKVKKASDEDIAQAHEEYFIAMRNAMLTTIGEY